MKEWVAKRVTELLGIEEEVLISMIHNHLTDSVREKSSSRQREASMSVRCLRSLYVHTALSCCCCRCICICHTAHPCKGDARGAAAIFGEEYKPLYEGGAQKTPCGRSCKAAAALHDTTRCSAVQCSVGTLQRLCMRTPRTLRTPQKPCT